MTMLLSRPSYISDRVLTMVDQSQNTVILGHGQLDDYIQFDYG